MADFNTLYNEYEHTKDVCKFCDDYAENDEATRFLLVRSLDKNHLKDIVREHSDEDESGSIKALTEKAYNSSVSIEQLVSYIESKRNELITQREAELNGLDEVLLNFPVLNCGVRNDKVDDVVKSFVRNKSLKTLNELTIELDTSVLPRIRNYCLWSYYNQTSNDIIELFFLRHNAVLPTLRKIHDIDFFLKIEGRIIPFDLKFTHISDEYFNLASQGIVRDINDDNHDDFCVNVHSMTNEIQQIKEYYKQFKRNHPTLNLPNYGGLTKKDLCDILANTGDYDAMQFVSRMKQHHQSYVPSDTESLWALEWWNYKYQGERLFCNNNRLFVFIAFNNKFEDGRELKGKTDEIGEKINKLLDSLNAASIHIVDYSYEKDASLTGNYTALALSTIYSE